MGSEHAPVILRPKNINALIGLFTVVYLMIHRGASVCDLLIVF